MKNTYKINHTNGTITMTRDFAEKASIINTEEYKILRQLKKDNPNYKIENKTARVSPTKKTHKGLTLDLMERYIETFEPLEAMIAFNKVKAYNTNMRENNDGEVKEIINYSKVKQWFLGEFPKYYNAKITIEVEQRTFIIENLNEQPVIDIPSNETNIAKTDDENQGLPLAS